MLNKKDRAKEIKNIYTHDPKFESAVDIMAEILLKVIERQKNKKEQEEEYRKERQKKRQINQMCQRPSLVMEKILPGLDSWKILIYNRSHIG